MKKLIKRFLKCFGFKLVKEKNDQNINRFYELKTEHIKNLKIVLNRHELLKKMPKNGIVAELGVDKGVFSEEILSVTKPKKLYLIDLWDSKRFNVKEKERVESRFKEKISEGVIEVVIKDSVEAMGDFEDYYFDWVYIDTTHTYEQTKKELSISKQKVKKGGFIAGHDYSQGSVGKGCRYGVIAAVNEFCVENGWEFIFLTFEPGGAHSFAIKEMKNKR